MTVRPCDILGRTRAQLNAALLAAVTAHQIAQAGDLRLTAIARAPAASNRPKKTTFTPYGANRYHPTLSFARSRRTERR